MKRQTLWAGERPVTAEERAAYLLAAAESGLTTREFARRTGIPVQTVYTWRQRQRAIEAEGAGPFVELKVVEDPREWSSPPAASAVAEVAVDGLVIRIPAGFDATEIARLLDTVRSRC